MDAEKKIPKNGNAMMSGEHRPCSSHARGKLSSHHWNAGAQGGALLRRCFIPIWTNQAQIDDSPVVQPDITLAQSAWKLPPTLCQDCWFPWAISLLAALESLPSFDPRVSGGQSKCEKSCARSLTQCGETFAVGCAVPAHSAHGFDLAGPMASPWWA